MNWNTPLINGFPGQPFISKESFRLYSISPDCELMDLDWLPDLDTEQTSVEVIKEVTKEKSHAKNDKMIKQKRLPQPLSALTSDQHKKFLELNLKYHFNKPSNHEEQKEYNTLKELQGIVVVEQRDFMTYLRSFAELNAENYLQMFPPAENFISNYIKTLKERIHGYPQFYVSYNAINFAPTPDNQITNIFFRKNLLLEMGQVSRVLLPNLEKTKCFLPRNMNKIGKKTDCGPHVEVSRDGNVDKLAELFAANMAMSYAALECLFDNHAPHFNRQWELPVVVRRDPKGRKLVIIDDPFVAKEMTIPEKSQMVHQLLMKSFVVHPNHKSFFDLDARSENLGSSKDRIWEETEEPEGEDKRCLEGSFETMFEGNHLTDLERGVVSDIPSASEDLSRVEEDSSDAENLVIDQPPSPIVSYDGQNDERPERKTSCVSNQATAQPPAKKIKIDPRSVQGNSNLLDAILEQQSVMLSAAPNGPGREAQTNVFHEPGQRLNYQLDDRPVLTCEGYERPTEKNVSYSLWMMGKMNVILKDHYHGYMKIKKFGGCFTELFTKMEYQKSHGFEHLSESELSRMWLALQMKPSVKNILLGRVDAFTSEFLKHEQIMRENLNWNFSKCLQQLHVVLKACGELDFGSFLISHTQGSKNFQIKKTTNNQNGAYNLYLAYEQPEVKLSAHQTFERHWLPIDLNVPGKFTPVSRIPCTFEPRDAKKANNTKQKKKKT